MGGDQGFAILDLGGLIFHFKNRQMSLKIFLPELSDLIDNQALGGGDKPLFRVQRFRVQRRRRSKSRPVKSKKKLHRSILLF